MFSLYPYSYVYSKGAVIRLLNIRQLKDALTDWRTLSRGEGFIFAITQSRKKHLFYKAMFNDPLSSEDDIYSVNMEGINYTTTPYMQKQMFGLVECLQALGMSKSKIADWDIPFSVAQPLIRCGILDKIILAIKVATLSQEIYIPIYAAQKPEGMSVSETLCTLENSANRILRRQR